MSAATSEPERLYGLRGWGIELRRYGWIHLVIGLALAIAVTDPSRIGWAEAGRRLLHFELVTATIGLTVTGIYAAIANRLLDRQGSPLRRALIHTLTLVVGVGVGGEVGLFLLPFVGASPLAAEFRAVLWRVGGSIGALAMTVSVLYDRVRSRARDLEIAAERAERELLRAQLVAVQSRMHPHFLFNSLNTLADLIDEDPRAAIAAIERLAALLRYSLEGEREAEVPLSRELAVIDDYIALERLRFGERLRFVADVEADALDAPIPPFILQPAVENAVKHGVAASRHGATVLLTARRRRGGLELVVEDDGPGSSTAAGTKTGEASLRQRLRLLYGDRASLECDPRPGGGYRVCMRIEPHAPEVSP